MSQHPLDYQSPKKKRRKPSVPYSRSMAGTAIGVVVTVPAALLAGSSISLPHAGGGDGTAAQILYPLQCMMPISMGCCCGLVQYPLYGLVIGLCSGLSRKACIWAILVIAAVHLYFVLVCMWWGPQGFQ